MLAVQDVRLDPSTRQVWRGEREIRLSRKEFQLLHALMARPDDIVTRGELMAMARMAGPIAPMPTTPLPDEE